MPNLKIKIKSQGIRYPIVIKTGLMGKLAKTIRKKHPAKKYAIVTDSRVKKLFGNRLQKELKTSGADASLFDFPAGEKHKTLSTVEQLGDRMIRAGCDRTTLLVALGGGVTGDVAGFVASLFMRGMPYIHVPTTLLAMTDSAIGGKTGVNSRQGKNMYGAFHHPQAVYIDPELLKDLPQEEFLNGFAELLKCGLIRDKKLVRIIEKKREKILGHDLKTLEKILTRGIRVKKEVVEKDEKEEGLRMLINYGHTFGHAIEKASRYKVKHGFAVAIGMEMMNKICVRRRWMKREDKGRITKLLKAYHLPTEPPPGLKMADLLRLTAHDKKRKGGVLHIVTLDRIGKAVIRKGELLI